MQNFSKSIHIWILLVLLGATSAWAQTAPTVQWERVFDRESEFGTTAFINVPTSDGGALVAVFGNKIKNISTTTSNGDAIVKLNANNEVVWAKMTNDLVGIPIGPYSEIVPPYRVTHMTKSVTGGYFVIGYWTSSGYYENFIMKISENGDAEWVIRNSVAPNSQANYKTIAATNDGGIVIGTEFIGRASGSSLSRYDAKGNLDFINSILFNAISNNLLFAKIEKIRNDGNDLLAIGSYNETPTQRRGFVAKLSADLKTIWLKRDTDEFVDIIRDPKKDRYLAIKAGGFTGGSLNNPISAFDLNGGPINIYTDNRPYSFTNNPTFHTDPQGNLFVGANGLDINTPGNPERFFLIKLNSYASNGTDRIAPSVAYESARKAQSFNIAPDGSYIKSGAIPRDASSNFGYIEKLINTPTPPTGSFALTAPNYDCNTGALTLNTTGGNGAPIEYRIIGLRDWAASSSFSVPAHQRTGTSFTLEARQNGQIVTLPFTTACGTTTPPPSNTNTQPTNPPNAFGIASVSYDCNTGQLNVVINNTNSEVSYRIAGLRDWSDSNVFTVPAWQRTNTTFRIEARNLTGRYDSRDFTTSCATTPPPSTTPTQPTTPGNAFSIQLGGYNCNTGQLSVFANNANSEVEYRIVGLRDWSSDNNFTVPAWQRTNTTFRVEARSRLGQYSSANFTTSCGSARMAGAETALSWQVAVLGNPVEEQVQVRLSGLAGQAVGLSVVDATGRVVAEQQVAVGQEGQLETLRLGSTGGVYVLRAISQGQQQTVKIVKK